MERFFYTDEQDKIDAIAIEIDSVNSRIDALKDDHRSKYQPQDVYRADWLFYTSSSGDVIQEQYIRDNFTRYQVLKRVLMKSIEVLHSYQDRKK